MMSTLKYKITFLSYWAVGSGKGGGLGADSLVLKENDLPIIPGKTLKGLWREAYREQGSNKLIQLFGHEKHENDDDKEKPNIRGSLYFHSARLPKSLREDLAGNKAISKELFHFRTSTALDSNKQAKEHSLRKMEVCVPLTLEAEIEGVTEDDKENLLEAMKGIRLLGEKRYRGLGRCKVKEIKIEKNV